MTGPIFLLLLFTNQNEGQPKSKRRNLPAANKSVSPVHIGFRGAGNVWAGQYLIPAMSSLAVCLGDFAQEQRMWPLGRLEANMFLLSTIYTSDFHRCLHCTAAGQR